MERQEIKCLEDSFRIEIGKVSTEQQDLKNSRSGMCETVSDYDRFNLMKKLLDDKESDLEKKLICNKNRINSYYNDIKEMRTKVLVTRSALQIKKNQKRRIKRSVEKSKRMKEDNGLVENTEVSVDSSGITTTKTSDSEDEEEEEEDEDEE